MSALNLESIKSIAQARASYTIVWNVIFVWDTLATLRIEYSTIWRAKWTWLKAFFLLNRYGSLVWSIGTCVTQLAPMSHATCRRVYWIQLVEIVYILLVAHSIVAIRVYAIYERSRKVKWSLIVYLATETAIAIAAMSDYRRLAGLPTRKNRAAEIRHIDDNPNRIALTLVCHSSETALVIPKAIAEYIRVEGCITTPRGGVKQPQILALNILPACYDTVILAAVVWRNFRMTKRIGQPIPVFRRLIKDGTVYYVVITVTHAVTAVMYTHTDESIRTFNVAASATLGSAILIWDTLATLRIEKKAIWSAKWTLLKAAFLLNRYGSLVILCTSTWTTIGPVSDTVCGRVYWIQHLAIVWVLVFTEIILGLRVLAIYAQNRWMKCSLIVWLLMLTSVSIAAMSIFDPLVIPQPIRTYINFQGCATQARPGSNTSLVTAVNILPAFFDTGVLAAIILRNLSVTRRIGTKVPILSRLLLDGAIYFIAITTTHVVTATMYAHADPALRVFNIPASLVLGSVASSRLVLTLYSRPPPFPNPSLSVL